MTFPSIVFTIKLYGAYIVLPIRMYVNLAGDPDGVKESTVDVNEIGPKSDDLWPDLPIILHPFVINIKKSKDPEGYFRRHETELQLCDGAAYMLKKEGLDPDKIDLNAPRADYAEMKQQKDESMKTYADLSAETKSLEKLTKTLERYLERQDRTRARTDGNDALS